MMKKLLIIFLLFHSISFSQTMLGRSVSTVLSELKGARIIEETQTSLNFEFNNKFYLIENSKGIKDYNGNYSKRSGFVQKQGVIINEANKQEFYKLCDRLEKRGYIKFSEKTVNGAIMIKYNYVSKKNKKYLMKAIVVTSPENNQTLATFEWGNWSN